MKPKIYITIKKNTDPNGIAKQVNIDTHSNFQDVLERVGKKLNIEAKKLYTESGAEIDATDDIRDDTTVYVSQGEVFFKDSASKQKIFHSGPEAITSAEDKKASKCIKFGVIGEGSVGKSSLIVRYTRNFYNSEYIPSIEEVYKKRTKVGDEPVEMDILDTTGMEEFVVMRPMWYKGRDSFFMIYSITSRNSFRKLKELYEELLSHRPDAKKKTPEQKEIIEKEMKKGKPDESATIIVIGNKSDLESEREISKQEGMDLAKEWDAAAFFETSAKTNKNVNEAFVTMSRIAYHKKYPVKPVPRCNLL